MLIEAEKRRELQFMLYRFLLEKYSELINNSEKKTIGEIKGLVDAGDLTVQSLLSELKPEDYSYEQHFLQVLERLFELLCSEIEFVEAGIDLNFWLTPKEIFELKICDDDDFSVLLCSFMQALGNENAFVVISEMDNLSTHAFVVSEFKGNFILLDPSQKHPFSRFMGEKAAVMQDYSFNGAKIKRFLYRFNSKDYEQFSIGKD